MKKRIDATTYSEDLKAIRTTASTKVPRSHAPASGQFHALAVESSPWNEFVLVLEKKGNTCTVIPGNMDATLGGPDDILIPGIGSEPYWMINISTVYELPDEALLPAFAKASTGVLNYVKKGLEKSRRNESFDSNYRFCLPYLGSNDSRIAYHKGQAKRIKQAKEYAEKMQLKRMSSAFIWTIGKSDIQTENGNNVVGTAPSASSYALAAGEKKEKIRMSFVSADYPCEAILKWSPETEKLYVDVYDLETGARDEETLEGFQLRSLSDGLILGSVQRGHLSVVYSKDLVKDGNGFYLARPDGEPLNGEWKKK